MIGQWLREDRNASYLLAVLRIWLGYEWLMAGWHKIFGFNAEGFLRGAVAKAGGEHPMVQDWWASFLDAFAIPNAGLFNFIIPWGEVAVGLGLIFGCFTVLAVFFGLVMNFAFLFSGSISSNPNMIIVEFIVLYGAANAGRIGLDHWVQPYIADWWAKRRHKAAA